MPGIYIIGMSGSFQALNEPKDEGIDVCLSKPYSISKIEKAIEDRFCPSMSGFAEAAFYRDEEIEIMYAEPFDLNKICQDGCREKLSNEILP